jgi:hypothetical protein
MPAWRLPPTGPARRAILRKVWEERRTRITKPLLEAKREVDALFAGPANALKAIQYKLRNAMHAHHARVEAARQTVVLESVAKVAAGVVPTAIIPAATKAPGVTIKQVWAFEIVNPDEVPREYCSPDPKKIPVPESIHVQPVCPGVRYYLDERSTIR